MSSKICIFKAQDLQRFPAANTAPHWLLNRSQADIDFLLQRDSYLKITQWPLSFLYQAIVYYHADLEFLLRYNHREMCAYVAFLQLICNPETVFECPFWHFVICFIKWPWTDLKSRLTFDSHSVILEFLPPNTKLNVDWIEKEKPRWESNIQTTPGWESVR